MDQKDFTKTVKSQTKIEHEGGDSLNEDGIEGNSIGEDDERNSPQNRVSVNIEKMDEAASPKRSRTQTDGFHSKAAVDSPKVITLNVSRAPGVDEHKMMVPGDGSQSVKSRPSQIPSKAG